MNLKKLFFSLLKSFSFAIPVFLLLAYSNVVFTMLLVKRLKSGFRRLFEMLFVGIAILIVIYISASTI